MSFHFDKHAQKGNRFLNDLAAGLGEPFDTQRAGRMLRCIFRVLRDHLTPEESFQLLSQLPMALKAVYVDAWIPQKQKEKSRTINDFINEVIREDGIASWRDFSNADDVLNAARAVFTTLKKHVSEGEFRDMESVLPRDMKKLLQNQENNRLDIVIGVTPEA